MFVSNWQLPSFNQQKEENDNRNYFMIDATKSYVAKLRFEQVTPWICRQTATMHSTMKPGLATMEEDNYQILPLLSLPTPPPLPLPLLHPTDQPVDLESLLMTAI